MLLWFPIGFSMKSFCLQHGTLMGHRQEWVQLDRSYLGEDRIRMKMVKMERSWWTSEVLLRLSQQGLLMNCRRRVRMCHGWQSQKPCNDMLVQHEINLYLAFLLSSSPSFPTVVPLSFLTIKRNIRKIKTRTKLCSRHRSMNYLATCSKTGDFYPNFGFLVPVCEEGVLIGQKGGVLRRGKKKKINRTKMSELIFWKTDKSEA